MKRISFGYKILISAVFFLMSAVLLSFTFVNSSDFCFADDEEELTDGYTLKYYYDSEEFALHESLLPFNSRIEEFPSFYELTEWGFPVGDLPGKEVKFYIKNNGNKTELSLPYEMTSDLDIYIELESNDELYTIRYIYNYFSEDVFQVEVHTFHHGEKLTLPYSIGTDEDELRVSRFYLDPELTLSANDFYFINEDAPKDFYAKLDKKVTFTLNGESFETRYGKSLYEATARMPYHVLNFYTDEEKTQKFEHKAIDGLTLYGDYVLTHYAVNFTYLKSNTLKYIPISDDGTATITEDYIPGHLKFEGELTWRTENDLQVVTFPYVITGNISLVASESGTTTPSQTDVKMIFVYIAIALVVVGIAVGGFFFEKKRRAKAKNKTAQYRSDNLNEQLPDKRIEEQSTEKTSDQTEENLNSETVQPEIDTQNTEDNNSDSDSSI